MLPLPQTSPPPIKKALSRGAYIYRRLTSRWRRLPDFIIIGAQKSGTSSLFYYLSQHPSVAPSFEKEIHYYNYYQLRGRGLDWYKSFFPLRAKSGRQLTGEASPSYLYSDLAPAQIRRDVPGVKLIALLRDPIERAYSEYNMHVRHSGRSDLPTFEQAIANEDLSSAVSRVYLLRGLYARHLRTWFRYFDRSRFLLIKSEDFFADPASVLDEVDAFLGVERTYPGDLAPQQAGSYDELSSVTRESLSEYFRGPNAELVELLGERFRW